MSGDLTVAALAEETLKPLAAQGFVAPCGRPNNMAVTATDPIKIIFAVLLPPVGVFLEVGLTGHFWLNILLTLLGYVPGIIHALYVILKH